MSGPTVWRPPVGRSLNRRDYRSLQGITLHVFAVRQVCEKYLANERDVFWAFMDLEKAYDTIDRHGM